MLQQNNFARTCDQAHKPKGVTLVIVRNRTPVPDKCTKNAAVLQVSEWRDSPCSSVRWVGRVGSIQIEVQALRRTGSGRIAVSVAVVVRAPSGNVLALR